MHTSPGHCRRHRTVIIACAWACALIGTTLGAQPPRPSDAEVKAVYLLNFGRFTRWPPAPAATERAEFGLCVLGRDPFGAALDAAVAGETIEGKRVDARRLTKPSDADRCRIVFISASESHRLKDVLKAVEATPTLTVSDMPQFAEAGGMIQFVAEGSRIRFTVNVMATERAGLTLSSELLRVAIAMKTAKRPGA